MKKALSFMLAATLILSLAACGNEGNTSNNNSTSATNELSVGDTLTSNIIEFTLTRVEFADQLKYASFSTGTSPDVEYMLPTDEPQSNKTFVAEDGYTMLSYSYTLRYTGKEEIEVETAMGITADYNDGYIFEVWSDAYMWSDYISIDGDTKLKPLDPQGEGRGCMKVPDEVAENADTPLKIAVSIPNGDGTFVDAIYTVR